ncbi:MAG: hypothetical protein IJU54_03100 [Alphaproteobacteria bacterium]|nr:hypothetical protein [Alphaproteobacteria bacterium]
MENSHNQSINDLINRLPKERRHLLHKICYKSKEHGSNEYFIERYLEECNDEFVKFKNELENAQKNNNDQDYINNKKQLINTGYITNPYIIKYIRTKR